MKQHILILLILISLIALLAALNAASYVQKEKVPDTEFAPNRSTFNSGTTGTQAFYALLSETGRKVVRWQSSLETIATDLPNQPSVFVMIGPLRRPLSDTETVQLMKWVADGGTLVLIDRDPSPDLATTTAKWQLSVAPSSDADLYSIDASDQKQMTANTPAQKSLLPSLFAHSVNAVQPSRFASSITLERLRDDKETAVETRSEQSPVPTPYDLDTGSSEEPPVDFTGEKVSDEDAPAFEAPIVHLGVANQNLLVEAPFEEGRVVVLSDPYIVSNAGINVVDNSRLAINLVTSRDGLIAFDEYHHGYGANNNRFFQYFEGTPILTIFLHCGLLVAIVFFSQSRRFARPVPEPEANRLSKLEYVSAMAELQQRTRAYDLAIENIYTDFRRRVSALVGLDNTTANRREIAGRIAERTGGDVSEIESLLFQCEDVIHGEAVGRRETISLVERLRKIEDELGLKRSRRTGV